MKIRAVIVLYSAVPLVLKWWGGGGGGGGEGEGEGQCLIVRTDHSYRQPENKGSQNITVGTVTRQRAGGFKIWLLARRIYFSLTFRSVLGPMQNPSQWVSYTYQGWSWPHINTMSILKLDGAKHLLSYKRTGTDKCIPNFKEHITEKLPYENISKVYEIYCLNHLRLIITTTICWRSTAN